MHIEIKQNQIVIEFSEKESSFIAQKAGKSKAEDISKYIKAKISKALALEELENIAMLNLGNDFNLDKIKNVSAELKKRKDKIIKPISSNDTSSQKSSADHKVAPLNDEIPVLDKLENMNLDEDLDGEVSVDEDMDFNTDIEMEAEIGDEILADLLDKDLLRGRRKRLGEKKKPIGKKSD